MKKLLMMLGAAAVAVGANAAIDTIEIDGVTWTYSINNAAAKTITLGGGTAATPAMPTNTVLDAANIPWTMEINGETYTVAKLANYAFSNCSNLTGQLSIPDTVTDIGACAFQNCSFGGTVVVPSTVTTISVTRYDTFSGNTNLEAIWIKGPATAASQTYTTVCPHGFATSCTSLKMVLMGKNTKNGRDGAQPLNGVPNADWFEPTNFEDANSLGSLKGNRRWKYGPGEEFDLEIDDTAMTATFTPTTEAALTNAFVWASSFKTHFGLDTVISITNTIETSSAAVEIMEEALENVTLNAPSLYLTFQVKTQAQLNRVLAAVSGPIVADITGATEEIVVPEGRQVAVLVPDGATFNYHKRGLIISFH